MFKIYNYYFDFPLDHPAHHAASVDNPDQTNDTPEDPDGHLNQFDDHHKDPDDHLCHPDFYADDFLFNSTLQTIKHIILNILILRTLPMMILINMMPNVNLDYPDS